MITWMYIFVTSLTHNLASVESDVLYHIKVVSEKTSSQQ